VNKSIANRAALLAALAPQIVPFPVEGLGVVHIKEFTALQRVDLLGHGEIPEEPAEQFKFMAALLPRVITDSDGKALLKASDVDALINGKGSIVQKLINKMLEVNGITKAAADTIEKNSETTPNSDSSTT